MPWDPLGLNQPVEQARATVNETLLKLAPLFAEIENRAGGIGESLLDRIDGATITATITIKLTPIPKATPVE